MNTRVISGVMIPLVLLLAGCETTPAPGGRHAAPAWVPPPVPAEPPPISVAYHFGLPPPRYPFNEARNGIQGEVLLEVRIDENHRLAEWKVVRSTNEGFAVAVTESLSRKGVAPGVPPGIYSYCVVFVGESFVVDDARPATLWVSVSPFGRSL